MTYQLGWSVIPQILVRRERWPGGYKTKGIPLVHPGQDVLPDQPILRLEKNEPVEAIETVPIPRLLLPGVIDTLTYPDHSSRNGDVSLNRQHADETLPAGLRGRVVDITPGPLNFAMLRQAMISGVVGVIASSISSRDFEGFLRTDLIELIDSVDVELAQAHLPQMTVLLTEGLGTIAMPARTMNLLSHYQGSIALLSGATSVRQGIFPELVISLPAKEVQQNWHPVQPDPILTLGAQVRVCSGDHEGAIGSIDYLYSHEQVFPSGIRARAARLRLEDGSMLTIPLTLVERIS